MGFAEVLTALFIALKLTHVIDWSWWWVVSPELISIGFLVVLVFGIITTALVGIRKVNR